MYATAFDEFKRHILITELSNLGDTLRTTVFWFIIGRTGTWICVRWLWGGPKFRAPPGFQWHLVDFLGRTAFPLSKYCLWFPKVSSLACAYHKPNCLMKIDRNPSQLPRPIWLPATRCHKVSTVFHSWVTLSWDSDFRINFNKFSPFRLLDFGLPFSKSAPVWRSRQISFGKTIHSASPSEAAAAAAARVLQKLNFNHLMKHVGGTPSHAQGRGSKLEMFLVVKHCVKKNIFWRCFEVIGTSGRIYLNHLESWSLAQPQTRVLRAQRFRLEAVSVAPICGVGVVDLDPQPEDSNTNWQSKCGARRWFLKSAIFLVSIQDLSCDVSCEFRFLNCQGAGSTSGALLHKLRGMKAGPVASSNRKTSSIPAETGDLMMISWGCMRI